MQRQTPAFPTTPLRQTTPCADDFTEFLLRALGGIPLPDSALSHWLDRMEQSA